MVTIYSEINKLGLFSRRNDFKVFLFFVNRTECHVHIIWLNFNGDPVIYKTIPPNNAFPVVTHEQHPWVFKDSRTGDRMLGNGEELFYPKQDKKNPHRPLIILLTYPLISLRQRALQAIRDSIERIEDIERSQIPSTLLNDIDEALALKETALEHYRRCKKFVNN
ncbi:von Hippel-Lindau disease tumor suppressor-like [Lycorma delicatula]|uniref:von Hippel-Lindau disease tumor suppressor-like n=1 Tax=Lycorma delicatula TaxID=130591 RepID=UPI003F510D1C